MKRMAGAMAVAAALAMVAYRFTNLDLVAFARDEPQFLEASRQQLRTGRWLTANPLYGNLGLRYGPVSFWYYGVVQALFGDAPRAAIVAMGTLVTASHVAFAWALARAAGLGPAGFGVLLAWLASSIYQFFWSRIAWDLTSNAAAFATAALVGAMREWSAGRALALGLVVGLGLATHPSVAPLALAVLVILAWDHRGLPKRLLARAAALGAGIALVSLPYWSFLLRARRVGRAPHHELSLEGLSALLLEMPRTASAWGLEYYFDGQWGDFQDWLGGLTAAAEVFRALALALIAVGVAAGLAVGIRSADPRLQRLARMGLVAWPANVLLVAALRLESHSHYFFASAWVPFVGVAALVAEWTRTRPRAGAFALAIVAALAAGQFATVVAWMGYVRDRGGIRGPAYGTALAGEVEAVRAACSRPEPALVLRNETAMYAFPFRYLATTTPECQSKMLSFCGEGFWPAARPCPPLPPGTALVRLRYRDPTGARLAAQ